MSEADCDPLTVLGRLHYPNIVSVEPSDVSTIDWSASHPSLIPFVDELVFLHPEQSQIVEDVYCLPGESSGSFLLPNLEGNPERMPMIEEE